VTLDDFERAVMAALLAGDDPLLAKLRAQYAAANVRDREMEHNGFITRFDVPDSAPGIDRKLLHLDDLQVELEGAETPIDASLRVHNGRLRSLECFVYGGELPREPVVKAAWYYGTARYPAISEELMAERDVEGALEEDE
jgi:hypothetical protein